MIEAPLEQISAGDVAGYARDRIAAAMEYPKARLERRRVALPALDLDLWFSSPDLADACAGRLVHRRGTAEPGEPRQIHLIDATMDGWDAPAVWDTDTGFSSRVFDRELAAAGLRGFYHHDAPSWQFYDPAAAVGVHTLPSPMGIPPWEMGSPLRLFLHWGYASDGRRLTHAATLGVEGRGALIAGASGSGKSGTTLAGLMHGLTSAGDDYVLVEQGADVTAHAVFRVFKQDREGLARVGLEPVDIGAGELNWHGKYEFDACDLAPDAFVERLTIRAVLLPEIARQPMTEIARVSPRVAALALAPSGVFQLPGDTAEGFRFLAELARRLPAYRVRLSEDPAEIADVIGTFLLADAGHAR